MDNMPPTGQLASRNLGPPPEGTGDDLVFYSRPELAPIGFGPGNWVCYFYVSHSTVSSMLLDIGEYIHEAEEVPSNLWKRVFWTPVEGWNEVAWSDPVFHTIASGRYLVIDTRPSSAGSITILWNTDTYNSRLVTPSLREIVPPKITMISPGFKTYNTSTIPLIFTIDEATLWICYSLDGQMNTTIAGNITLQGLLPGKHNLRIYANDTSGNIGSSTKVFFNVFLIMPHAPRANFTAYPVMANIGKQIELDASSSLPGWNGTHDKPITRYCWDFDDGNQTITYSPIIHHSYSSPGTFTVTLTVYALGATPETNSTILTVTVISVPVGGYSTSTHLSTTTNHLALYLVLIAALSVGLIINRNKRKPKTQHTSKTFVTPVS